MDTPSGRYEIVNGECHESMKTMGDDAFDAIVTDPPYNLGFMGAGWDSYGFASSMDADAEYRKAMDYVGGVGTVPRYGNSHGHRPKRFENVAFQEAMTPIFEEALRVAKPGAYCLAFSSPRTYHRLACAIEDAGWIPVNTLMWVFGSGFPKGLNVSKALAKQGELELAERYYDWNTQLKPAWEPILMAQKPLDGTVAHNVIAWGVGAMNIGACRIPIELHDSSRNGEESGTRSYRDRGVTNWGGTPGPRGGDERGRFPANLIHDGSDEVLSMFPDSKGQQGKVTGTEQSRTGDNGIYGHYGARDEFNVRGDSGSAARFFYCAKASKADRNCGGADNKHTTVKPNALMRYLVRLVCPEGGGGPRPVHGERFDRCRLHGRGNAIRRHRDGFSLLRCGEDEDWQSRNDGSADGPVRDGVV